MPRSVRFDVVVDFFPDGYKLRDYLQTFEGLIKQAKTTDESNIIMDGFEIVGAEFEEEFIDGEQ